MKPFALALDTYQGIELHMFASDAERTQHLWELAGNHCGTSAATLDEFKAEWGDDIAAAMESAGIGWSTGEACA